MISAEELLTDLDLTKKISLSGNWPERNDEQQRLVDMTTRVNAFYELRIEDCKTAIALIRATEERPVNTNPISRQELAIASETLDNAYKGVIKPWLYRIKDLHGDRIETRDDKERHRENEKKIKDQEDRYAKIKNKVNMAFMEVDDALDAKAAARAKDERRDSEVDLRHKLDQKRDWKEKGGKPDLLTTEHTPEQMRRWKAQFKVWHKNSQFHNAPNDVQFSYFLQAIGDDVQTELQIGEDDIEADNIALFPEQAEEMELERDDCMWEKLDEVFERLHPLTKLRFDLIDGKKESGESISALHRRIVGMVKSAKIDEMSAENWEAVFMLKYLSTTNPEIVEKVLEKASDPESSEEYRKNLKPKHILAKADAARAVSVIQGKSAEQLHKVRHSRNGSRSESRSNTNNRQGEGKRSLPRDWREFSPDSKRKALFQAGVCMRCGGSHGKKSCEHADSPKECEKCGRNNHTTAACFAKDGKEESGTSSRSRRRGKKRSRSKAVPRNNTPSQESQEPSEESN